MAGWSSLGGFVVRTLFRPSSAQRTNVVARNMSEHRTMQITPSRWQYQKLKDLIHFYTMVGAIPLGALILYVNIFVGPAKLQPIPEGYEPKHWEYYKHPITRWMARYMVNNPQQEYEKYMHHLYEEDEKMKMRRLEAKVRDVMAEKADYQAYYYKPISGKYIRQGKRLKESLEESSGLSLD